VSLLPPVGSEPQPSGRGGRAGIAAWVVVVLVGAAFAAGTLLGFALGRM
jgi:hypothetical protein